MAIDSRSRSSRESQPGIVLAIWQVYNSNAITCVPDNNAGWYLPEGGGATRLGGRGVILIARPGGKVISCWFHSSREDAQ
jgi:hypothetical protein